jgi:rRNA maturation RNase YbeY
LSNFELYNESGLNLPLAESDFSVIISAIESGESVDFRFIEAVYVNETAIQEVNQKYLGKNYITDVITFTYSDDDADNQDTDGTELEGTIYMCAQRIKEQASELNVNETEEFRRVFIHGLLHLCGYSDTDELSKAEMTLKENHYLAAI